MAEKNPTKTTDTIIIGAGPGGYVAAIRAAQLGQKVTIIEKENLGGVCLNVGCIPSKALITAGHRYNEATHSSDIGIVAEKVTVDFSKVQNFKNSVVNKLTSGVGSLLKGNKVEIVKGEATFLDANQLSVKSEGSEEIYSFKNAIIATGSRPVELPTFKFSNRVLSSTGALNLDHIPESLAIIGGGVIGIELGTAYANLGTKVTVLEGMDDILAAFEKQMSSLVKRNLKKKGVDIYTKVKAKGVTENDKNVVITYEENDEEKTLQAEYVLVTVGRRPNTHQIGLEKAGVEMDERGLIKTDQSCHTSVPHIFAIGDIIAGPQLAHKASYEGKIAAEAIAGQASEIDYRGIPAVVFSEPELATVGYTEKQAKDEGIEIITSKFPFAANGRALALNSAEGFMKLITRKEDEIIIGAQIAGPGASDMIAELGLAIESCLTAEDIALTIHAHPTLGEIAMEAAEIAVGTPIHIIK